MDYFLIGKFSLVDGEKRKIQHENGINLLYNGIKEVYNEAEPENWKIERTAEGKPFFPEKPELKFNISHSGEHCAIIISDSVCGVDIEELRPFPQRVLKRICTHEEQKYLSLLAEKEQETAKWMLWTLKESYVKAIGKGLSFGMKNISFTNLPNVESSEKFVIEDKSISFIKKENMNHINHPFGDFYTFIDGIVCVSFCKPYI